MEGEFEPYIDPDIDPEEIAPEYDDRGHSALRTPKQVLEENPPADVEAAIDELEAEVEAERLRRQKIEYEKIQRTLDEERGENREGKMNGGKDAGFSRS